VRAMTASVKIQHFLMDPTYSLSNSVSL
jgi:hypothetical protein